MGRIGELHMWVGKCLSPKRCCQCFGKSCVKKVSTKLLIFVFSLCGLCLLWVAGRLWVNGVAGAQWNVCKLAAKVTRGWQLSPDFPSKQRRGTAAEPGSGPQRHGHWAWLCSVDDNNTLVMFSLLDLSSYGRGGEKRLLLTGSWRVSLSSCNSLSTYLDICFVRDRLFTLFSRWFLNDV